MQRNHSSSSRSRTSSYSQASEKSFRSQNRGYYSNNDQRERPNITSTPEPPTEAVVEEERFNRDGSKSIIRRVVTARTTHAYHENEVPKVEVHISPATETIISPSSTPSRRVVRDSASDYSETNSLYKKKKNDRYNENEIDETYSRKSSQQGSNYPYMDKDNTTSMRQRNDSYRYSYEEETEEFYKYEAQRNEENSYYNHEEEQRIEEEEKLMKYEEEQRLQQEVYNEQSQQINEQQQMMRDELLSEEQTHFNASESQEAQMTLSSNNASFNAMKQMEDYRLDADDAAYQGRYTENSRKNTTSAEAYRHQDALYVDGHIDTTSTQLTGRGGNDHGISDVYNTSRANNEHGRSDVYNENVSGRSHNESYDMRGEMNMSSGGNNMSSGGNNISNGGSNMSNGGNIKSGSQGVTLAYLENKAHQSDINIDDLLLFLKSDDTVLKSNTAAYIMHLSYNDEKMKQAFSTIDIIPLLVELMTHEDRDCHGNAAGALKNLSYGKFVDDNKIAIERCGGVKACAELLYKTSWIEVREHITGILYNISSVHSIKGTVLVDAMEAVAILIIIPLSGWDKSAADAGSKPGVVTWSSLLVNSTGVLRNVCSWGVEARTKIRAIEGLVDALIWILRAAISSADKNDINNKIVENVTCSIRNLNYKLEFEVDRNIYLDAMKVNSKENNGNSLNRKENTDPTSPLVTSESKQHKANKNSTSTGCIGMKKKPFKNQSKNFSNPLSTSNKKPPPEQFKYLVPIRDHNPKPIGCELLWQPEAVSIYVYILTNSTNPITLEASAGAIHNLCACSWNWSALLRVHVRLQKGIPPMHDLLTVDQEYVVRSVAYTLRNLSIDKTNKWSIGKFAHKGLIQVLPRAAAVQMEDKPSEYTISAILSVLQLILAKDYHNSKYVKENGGIQKLVALTRPTISSYKEEEDSKEPRTYSKKINAEANKVLLSMWEYKECRDVINEEEEWSHSKAENNVKSFKSETLKKKSVEGDDIYADIEKSGNNVISMATDERRFLNVQANDGFWPSSSSNEEFEMAERNNNVNDGDALLYSKQSSNQKKKKKNWFQKKSSSK